MAQNPIIRCRLDLTATALPHPIWPPGTGPIRFEPARHAAPAHGLLVQAYSRGGGRVLPYPTWWSALQGDPEYDPTLCFIAENRADGAVIGFAQCWTCAFVKDIAVAADRRGTGLGRALMLTVFHAFKARGAAHVDLKVEADNPSGAVTFYRALGMAVVTD